ncbi:adenine phosphoribosyltransferase [Leptolyngbya valderiana BDU 20041]|nr:adenine phosphoribosyltransferase [Leptolyngbya valderiana BDU 20041]
MHDQLLRLIKDVPDFPKPGIVFKDFTPLLADPGALALAVELMVNPFRGKRVDLVLGAESRGFIFGTAIAQALSAGFVPIRKAGKLPRAVHHVEYQLEYGVDRLEIHADDINAGSRVLIVDDLLATGGTLDASAQLARMAGASIIGATVLIELESLCGREKLAGLEPLHCVLKF